MKKTVAFVLLLTLLAALCACGSGQTAPAAQPQNQTEETEAPEAANTDVLSQELAENERLVRAVPMIFTVPDGYHAYDTEGNYTEEMCTAQGVSLENMQAYMQVSGYDFVLVPAEETMQALSFEVDIRVKDNDNGVENLTELSDSDLANLAQMLVTGFQASDYTLYDTQDARFIVFDCTLVHAERRYASIINGKMVYFIAIPASGEMTDEQDALVKNMLDQLVIGA